MQLNWSVALQFSKNVCAERTKRNEILVHRRSLAIIGFFVTHLAGIGVTGIRLGLVVAKRKLAILASCDGVVRNSELWLATLVSAARTPTITRIGY